MTEHLVRFGDSRSLAFVPDESVHLVVTSPPYVTTEFFEGQEFDYQGHLDLMRDVFAELWRVLVPDGRFALNIADIHTKYLHTDDGRLHKVPLAYDTFAVAQAQGFRQLTQFIWDKGYTRNFRGPLLGSYPYPGTLYNNAYYEFIFILRKPGRRRLRQPVREASKLTTDEWRQYTQQWWRIESISEKYEGHGAVFPLEVPLRLIKMFSFVGDTVLDPFLGTGATTEAAVRANRNSVGVELDPAAERLVERRVVQLQQELLVPPFDLRFEHESPERRAA
jgi:DNA modification methylase